MLALGVLCWEKHSSSKNTRDGTPYLVILSHAHQLAVVVVVPVAALPYQDTLGTDARRDIFVEGALLQGLRSGQVELIPIAIPQQPTRNVIF